MSDRLLITVLLIGLFVPPLLGDIPMSSIESVWSQLRLSPQPGTTRVYAFTDRRGGYWQGSVYGDAEGTGPYRGYSGYTVNHQRLFRDVQWGVDGIPLKRQTATTASIWPQQVRHDFPGGEHSDLLVFTGRSGLSMTLQLDSTATIQWVLSGLSTAPLSWNLSRNQILMVQLGDHTVAIRVWTPTPANITHKIDSTAIRLSVLSSRVHVALVIDPDVNALQSTRQNMSSPAEQWRRENRHMATRLFERADWKCDDPILSQAARWAHLSGQNLVVDQYGGPGIWAGLPWFDQNWGRDTFIALPGIALVTGQFEQAKAIIRHFTRYQETDPESPLYGRIPNRVQSPKDIIYNTADGTPWLMRQIWETARYTGDRSFLEEMFPVVRHAIQGALTWRTDSLGFLIHGEADTWMDARIEGRQAWSPRGNRAIEIQALWATQLDVGVRIAQQTGHDALARAWHAQALELRQALRSLFVSPEKVLYDHLNPDGSPDHRIRPNQILAVTVPPDSSLFATEIQRNVLNQVVDQLTYPYGVASLSQEDPFFHPIHHHPNYHFDAAYHNGMCWHWLSGPVVSALHRFAYTRTAHELTRELARQLIHNDMPGSLSELVNPQPDPDGNPRISGTYSQAWSLSEFLRPLYEDVLGYRPNMLERVLTLTPHLPDPLEHLSFRVPIGESGSLSGSLHSLADTLCIAMDSISIDRPITLVIQFRGQTGNMLQTRIDLGAQTRTPITWHIHDNDIINATSGIHLPTRHIETDLPLQSTPPSFQKFPETARFPVLQTKDLLEGLFR